LKKLLSALLSITIIAAIGLVAYFNKDFIDTQCNKVKGMYYVDKGDKAYKKMKMSKAISFYNQGLKLYPQHYGAWYNLGNIYVAYEDYQSALYAYSQAFKYNPKMMVARMNYGIISSQKLGDFEPALFQYQKIIETKRHLISIPYIFNNKMSFKENKAIAYYNIGVTYRLKALYASDDWELQRRYMAKAIDAYQRAIEINPFSYDTQFNLGTAYHSTGNYQDAGKCYCNAIRLEPLNYEAHYNLAVLLEKLNHHSEAYDEIDKATTLITAQDDTSGILQYVSIVMNEIARNVYKNPEYSKQLKNEEYIKEQKLEIQKSNKKNRKKKIKEEKYGETITSEGIKFVNGKIVPTAKLDDTILRDFGQCPSMHYFDNSSNDEDI
jgi:tetratricopeptide (TPR) repeat protein